jgi:hypothetical protein
MKSFIFVNLCLLGGAARLRSSAPKLDVGFSAFEKNSSELVAEALNKTFAKYSWPAENLRANFSKQVVDAVQLHLQTDLKPLKKEIAKTWVLFKTDDDRKRYGDELKNSFLTTFARSGELLASHVNLAIMHAARIAKVSHGNNETQLLVQGVKDVETSLFEKHCFKNLRFNKTDPRHNHTETCIQSAMDSVKGKLKDAMGFVGMSLKFEAGVLSFVQGVAKIQKERHNADKPRWQ